MTVADLIGTLSRPPSLTGAKPYSGQIARDFKAIYAAADPTIKLRLIEAHLGRPISLEEAKAASAVVEATRFGGGLRAYHLAAVIRSRPECARLANDILTAFSFIDKTTPRWTLVYALVVRLAEGPAVEIGVTGLGLDELVARLEAQAKTGRDTRLRRFQDHAIEVGAVTYLWLLECFAGNLDDAQGTTNRWRYAATQAGYRVPQQQEKLTLREGELMVRDWPSYSEIAELGYALKPRRDR